MSHAGLDEHNTKILSAVRGGAADLKITTLLELYPGLRDRFEDVPAFVLRPRNEAAAPLVVSDDGAPEWRLSVDEGPPYGFMAGKDGLDSHGRAGYLLLRLLVGAVVAGRYRDEWKVESQRLVLRPWRHRTLHVWVASFDTTDGAIQASVYGLAPDREGGPRTRRYEPYSSSPARA
jgi:hypothetical protein